MSQLQTPRVHDGGSDNDITKPKNLYTVLSADEQPNLNKPTPPRTTWWYHLTLDTWVPEIVAVALSSASTIAIAAILRYYDKKLLPELPWGITLNAIVSILATISRSMLVYAVSTSIGQLKWCWYYEKRRKLADIQTMDAASRGPLGSIILLVSLRARPLATIGAIITILALAFDPAVQQILSYQSRRVIQPYEKSRLTRATALSGAHAEMMEWRNAITTGFSSSADRFERQLDCVSGNCTWPYYRSFGWCSKCQNATSYASITNCTQLKDDLIVLDQISDPRTCALGFGHGNQQPILGPVTADRTGTFTKKITWVLDRVFAFNTSQIDQTYLGVRNPFMAVGYAEIWPCHNTTLESGFCVKEAEECVLSLCETGLESIVTNGASETIVTDMDFGVITRGKFQDTYYCWQQADVANSETALDPSTSPKTSEQCPRSSIELDMNGGPGSVYFLYRISEDLFDKLSSNLTETYVIHPMGSPTKFFPEHFLDTSSDSMRYIVRTGLSGVLQGVAASLTQLGLQANTSYTSIVEGNTWVSESYVSVTWHWLILPVFLVTGSIVLLMVAALHNYRHGLTLWKSSILPLLYRSLDRDVLGEHPVLRNVGAMATAAEAVKVQLVAKSRRDRTVLTVS